MTVRTESHQRKRKDNNWLLQGKLPQNEKCKMNPGTVVLPCTLLPWGFNWLMPTQSMEISTYVKHFLFRKQSTLCCLVLYSQWSLSLRYRWKMQFQDYFLFTLLSQGYVFQAAQVHLPTWWCLLLPNLSQTCATLAEGVFPSSQLPR